ncbi:MAG: sulfurtransferase complex subunit TusB [Pseudomonadales bacterium]|jgi:tRNA 2-thiouridine synthesizing protein B|nr:sulfurtransferase complex subunit TusB [Pseudomonadales bacterium]
MSTLHLVNRPPERGDGLAAALRVAAPGDAVLLLEDGVYAAARGTEGATLLAGRDASVTLHVLEPDLRARGLAGRLVEDAEAVDDAGFVALAVVHGRTASWS